MEQEGDDQSPHSRGSKREGQPLVVEEEFRHDGLSGEDDRQGPYHHQPVVAFAIDAVDEVGDKDEASCQKNG